MIRRRSIDNDIEEKILTGLIVSDKVCRDTLKLIRKDTFVNPYSQVVSRWVSDYYRKYRKAPNKHIQDIYNTEKEKLKEEETILVGSFLSKLSDEFEKEDKLNEDYLIDKTVSYFKKRALKNISEQVESCVEIDKLDEAEKALQSYRQISKDSAKFINPFSDDEIKKFFEDEANNSNVLFRMPGALGNLIGDFERSTLVGIISPAKRGKSFLLEEVAIQAFFERLKVVLVSLEMPQFMMKRRLLRRITAQDKETKDYIYPCFDCFKNQMDSCTKSERTNHIKLRNDEGEKPSYDPNSDYMPCTVCRGKGKRDFIPEVWFTTIHRTKRTLSGTRRIAQGMQQMFRDNFRLVCYPKFSANVKDIKSDLETLEFDEDFIPDVIVIDYADILLPEDSRITGRDRYDETWKMFGNLAFSKRCLVVTASQTNRASADKKFVMQTDVSEDWRKVANVDLMIAINQTEEEKRSGCIRVSVIAGREEEFDQKRSCIVLQNLELGQVCLDSEIAYVPKNTKPKEDKK